MIKVHRHLVKKNNKEMFKNFKTDKYFPVSNSEVRLMEPLLANRLRLHNKDMFGAKTIDQFGINAKFVFYFPKNVFYTKKGLVNKKLPDLSNLYELPQDALTKSGVIVDDRIINSHNGSTRTVSFDADYWLEIELSKLD